MEQKHQQHNNFGSGFMLGVILGVAGTLLFTTKRGRAIFKEATDKGLDKFTDLEKQLQTKGEELIDTVKEIKDDYLDMEEETEDTLVEKKEETSTAHKETKEQPAPSIRKFFKKKS
jgi:gas vesicle protein